MSTSIHAQLEKLRSIHIKLSQIGQRSYEKVQIQHKIYQDLSKVFSKFSSKIIEMSRRINDEILSPSLSYNNEQAVIHHYQFLSNSLLKLGQCTKKISTSEKQQILQPMKIFITNYKTITDELMNRIVQNTTKVSQSSIQLIKHKENYYSAADKFQKSRQMQNKVMAKIQNGDKTQLQKFNAQIKKLSSAIITNQKSYKQNVQKINHQWDITKKSLQQTITSFVNNQQTRVSFSKRSVLSTLRHLQSFQNGYIKDAQLKLKQTIKIQKNQKNIYLDPKLFQTLRQLKNINNLEQFMTHQQFFRKQKRIQTVQQEHLQQIFKIVKNQDKQKIKQFVQNWFITNNDKNYNEQLDSTSTTGEGPTSNQNSPSRDQSELITKKKKNIKIQQQNLDDVKGKIIQVLPYSFYFIEALFNQIQSMTSFYCKLNDENFYYLLNTFSITTKSMDLGISPEIGSQFIYKMIIISQRISWKRSSQLKDHQIQLLSTHYCRNKQFFNNKRILNLIFNHIQQRKQLMKKPIQSKNAITLLTKNLFSRKKDKQLNLSPQQKFNCLVEMTNIMANFHIDNQISLTFIKDKLTDHKDHQSFDYLKGLIFQKKDTEQRRKIFFKTQVKQKRQKILKQVIQNKWIAVFCINITANKGFLSRDQINLRLISKRLINIHWVILSHIAMPTYQKWVHLLPYDRKMNYIQMKQQVAQKSVPSATQQIITLDVNRSLHIHGQALNPTILHTLLRTYAFYHQQISYCQGMNYIAGYLYLKTLNEQSAYRIFQYLMQVRFKQLFANEFEILKIKMYQFSRLLSIFHPQMSQHFKKQSISPECYIVSWIITLFASSYQYTMQSYVIDRLWQNFIIYGWTQFFKFVLWMFQLKKQQLLDLAYDRALHLLGEIAKSRFLLANNQQYKKQFKHLQSIQSGCARFQVTEELLQSLVKQYKLLK